MNYEGWEITHIEDRNRGRLPGLPAGMLAIPVVEWMWTRAVVSLIETCKYLPYGSTYALELGFSTISGKRDHLVEMFLANKSLRWLLFLDSDIVSPPDTLERLLACDADIAGGLYCLRQDPYPVATGHVFIREESVDRLRPTEVSGFRVKSLDLQDVDRGAVEVDVMGAACMLIHRHVLEELNAPWFVANEGTVRPTTQGQNEDWNFCLRARDAGFRIVCDTSLHIDHLGSWAISPSFARQVQRERVESAGPLVAIVGNNGVTIREPPSVAHFFLSNYNVKILQDDETSRQHYKAWLAKEGAVGDPGAVATAR